VLRKGVMVSSYTVIIGEKRTDDESIHHPPLRTRYVLYFYLVLRIVAKVATQSDTTANTEFRTGERSDRRAPVCSVRILISTNLPFQSGHFAPGFFPGSVYCSTVPGSHWVDPVPQLVQMADNRKAVLISTTFQVKNNRKHFYDFSVHLYDF
jgi:hypothetical protein